MNNLSLFLLLPLFLVVYYVFKKNNLLNENTSYSIHKNFGEANKSPIIIGGTFLIIVIILLFVYSCSDPCIEESEETCTNQQSNKTTISKTNTSTTRTINTASRRKCRMTSEERSYCFDS